MAEPRSRIEQRSTPHEYAKAWLKNQADLETRLNAKLVNWEEVRRFVHNQIVLLNGLLAGERHAVLEDNLNTLITIEIVTEWQELLQRNRALFAELLSNQGISVAMDHVTVPVPKHDTEPTWSDSEPE